MSEALTSLFSEGLSDNRFALSKLSSSIREVIDNLRGPIRRSQLLLTVSNGSELCRASLIIAAAGMYSE